MALLLKDCALATSFVTVAAVDSLGSIWLGDDKRTPNYPSLGLLRGSKLGDSGLRLIQRMRAGCAMTNVRQTIDLMDCFTATSLATD
jgi:hypothetical protein